MLGSSNLHRFLSSSWPMAAHHSPRHSPTTAEANLLALRKRSWMSLPQAAGFRYLLVLKSYLREKVTSTSSLVDEVSLPKNMAFSPSFSEFFPTFPSRKKTRNPLGLPDTSCTSSDTSRTQQAPLPCHLGWTIALLQLRRLAMKKWMISWRCHGDFHGFLGDSLVI